MGNTIIVQTTINSRDGAHGIAQALVECRLAACAQISGPIASTYWWHGQMEHAEEWVCTVKTRQELYGLLERVIRELHPYETPEIVATPIIAGNRSYLEWVEAEASALVS